MGGFFSPQQTPAQIIDPTAPALHPFREEFVRAVAGLLGNPPGADLSGLEEAAVLSTAGLAPTLFEQVALGAGGGYLPVAGRGNPYVDALLAGIESQGDVARRQLAGAAQRAGALESTDYLNAAVGLESQLAQKRGEVLANLFEAERGRQMQALGMAPGLASGLLDVFGLGRRARQEALRWPFELGLGLLGGQRAAVQPGETRPSPFASLLSGLAPFVPLVVK